MSVKKFAIACYDDETTLFPAVKKVRNSGYKLHDVYTPFAVHGLDEALGLKESDLHIAGFIFGILGTATALGFMTWIMTTSWPINYGGKPFFALPSFIPITFELTVLFSGVGMTLVYCYLNQIMPGVKKHVFHPRQTDDYFVIAIEITEPDSENEIMEFFKTTGCVETNVQTAEEGWWYGWWDKQEDYQEGFILNS